MVVTEKESAALVGISTLAFFITKSAIPKAMVTMRERGIFGIDINKASLDQRKTFGECKRNNKPFPADVAKYIVPESLGTVVGFVYLCAATAAFVSLGLPMDRANAALSSIAFSLLLGFVDDVLDVRWRHKVIFSAFATLPLVSAYAGPMWVAVPMQLRGPITSLLGPGITGSAVPESIRAYLAPYLYETETAAAAGGAAAAGQLVSALYLGPFYLVYMSLVCIFCTNSINILAGVNGVEVGQTLVIACAQLVHNVIALRSDTVTGADQVSHKLSLVILAPFIAGTYALWLYNRYPSRVFVGDSFTYLAGMVLAVAGITGVYSKTLLLFFFPQLLNFALSLPQLFGVIECPRHRVPRYDPKDGLLHNSRNLTVLNAILAVTGPLHERTLTRAMLLFQALSCVAALWVRHSLAGAFFEVVR